MNKKIIAVALALVMMVTCFTACKKKRETTKVNGQDVILVTDENGNPIINDKNEVVAVVTDRAGEVITYDNGEDQTYNIKLNQPLEVDGVVHGGKYRFNLMSGWIVAADGRICKDKTDNKCYYQFIKIKDLKDEDTLAAYLEAKDEENELLIPVFEQKGLTLTVESGGALIANGSIGTDTRKFKITDANGNVTHYAENYYFVKGTTIYAINFACEEGKGYDADFDFAEYLKTGFVYVD